MQDVVANKLPAVTGPAADRFDTVAQDCRDTGDVVEDVGLTQGVQYPPVGVDHLAVGVERAVGIREHRQCGVPFGGSCAVQQILCPAGPAGAGCDEDRVGEQFGPTVRIGAQFGSPAQPLDTDGKSASADGQLRGAGENVGDVPVGFDGRFGQMSGAPHQHLVIEPGEVSVRVAAFLGISLMNHRGANQWMTKDDLAQRIHHQKACLDRRCDVAHRKPGSRRGRDAALDAVQCRPQEFGPNSCVEGFQLRAEHRHQTLGQRQCAPVVFDRAVESRKLNQSKWIPLCRLEDRGSRCRRQRDAGRLEQPRRIIGIERSQRQFVPPGAGETGFG